MPLPRLGRGLRPRTADDDDWGSSTPAAIMNTPIPPPLSSSAQLSPRQPTITSDSAFSLALARFKQQELKSYTCTFSSRCVISLYFAIAIAFIPLGASIVASTANLASSDRFIYSNTTGCDLRLSDSSKSCVIGFNISKTLKSPSYIFYSLSNFHQNARDYVKSRSDIMNRGIVPKAKLDVENCERWMCEDGSTDCIKGKNGEFNATGLIYPCGLIARSFFNDTFKLCRDEDCKNEIISKKKGIAWSTDSTHKFKRGDAPEFNTRSSLRPPNKTANELLEDEDFVVWMRLSAFSTFDKLYRIIDDSLDPGVYFMSIQSNYPVHEFNGTKSFYISNTTWFGTGNIFLGTAFLIVGMTALFVAITFLFKHVLNPASPSNVDPAILLREHLEKLNIDADNSLHQQ